MTLLIAYFLIISSLLSPLFVCQKEKDAIATMDVRESSRKKRHIVRHNIPKTGFVKRNQTISTIKYEAKGLEALSSRNDSIQVTTSSGSVGLSEYLPFMRVSVSPDYPCRVQNSSSGEFREYRIIVTSTESYFPIFLNWLIYYYKVCPDTMEYFYFICFDKKIEANLSKYGLKCGYVHYLPSDKKFNRIWLIRAYVVRKLLLSGYDVLLSDSDALWLRNPFIDINNFANSDIISSRASYPGSVSDRLGAAFCMGFIYLKSVLSVINIWSEVTDDMSRSTVPDDQRIFNEKIMHLGVKFPYKLKYTTSIKHDTGSYYKKEYGIRNVTLLAHSLYRRHCDVYEKSVVGLSTVAHCGTFGKSPVAKHESESNFGLWRLRKHWKDSDPHNYTSMHDYLRCIEH